MAQIAPQEMARNTDGSRNAQAQGTDMNPEGSPLRDALVQEKIFAAATAKSKELKEDCITVLLAEMDGTEIARAVANGHAKNGFLWRTATAKKEAMCRGKRLADPNACSLICCHLVPMEYCGSKTLAVLGAVHVSGGRGARPVGIAIASGALDAKKDLAIITAALAGGGLAPA